MESDPIEIEQLGIEDPLSREPIKSSWDGLVSKLKDLKHS